jgi:1,4-dihydroxy-2-naphthoyl-CoA synthase
MPDSRTVLYAKIADRVVKITSNRFQVRNAHVRAAMRGA